MEQSDSQIYKKYTALKRQPEAMAGRRRRRRRRKRARQAADTHISSLPDDIMRRIFLLLPSLATLVRAACSCRAWLRAVASSPDFRRRFRALHAAPPLLGFFFNNADQDPCVATFAPVRLLERDLAAALRGGDFFLTSLHDRTNNDYTICDCRDGFVLLHAYNHVWREEKFFVFNPMMRHNENVSCIGDFAAFESEDLYAYNDITDMFQARLVVCSEQDPVSFLVVVLGLDCNGARVRASVLSSETEKWSDLPWVEGIPRNNSEDDDIPSIYIDEQSKMQANGSLFWLLNVKRHLISLDTATMVFSVQELPLTLKGKYTYDAGETKDGTACIVYSDQLRISVLMRTRGNDGLETWVLDKVVPMDAELERFLQGWHCEPITKLYVVAVRDGYAYLSTYSPARAMDPYRRRRVPCWFMSLCLETMKLEKLFDRAYDSCAFPYILPWPKCLSGNHGRFELEGPLGEDRAGRPV